MNFVVKKDRIILPKVNEFDSRQILECGQMFRYLICDDYAQVYSCDKTAKIVEKSDKIEIISSNPEYFVNFFDLETDYEKIKNDLKNDIILNKVIPFGEGIRICKNDIVEVMFSFVISANNNIPRIKKIIENLCKFGKKCDGFNAFPTLDELKELPLEVYSSLGAGYRDKYLFKLSRVLTHDLISDKMKLETNELRNWLISLPGIGPKVADCILLFGFSRMDCFPVDTWVAKVYEKFYYQGEKTRPMIAKFFVDRFKQNSGYAQQYLFYGARSNEFLKV